MSFFEVSCIETLSKHPHIHIWKNLALPYLETLELDSVNLPTVETHFWSPLKHLKRLRIQYCTNVNELIVAQICRTLHGLLEFEFVQYYPEQTDQRLRLCLSDLLNVRGLQKLRLVNVILDIFLNWGRWPQFEELRYLALTECGFFNGVDDVVDVGQCLLDVCPNLSTLNWVSEGNETWNLGLFRALPRFSTLVHFSYEHIKDGPKDGPKDEPYVCGDLERSKKELAKCLQLKTLAFPGDSLLDISMWMEQSTAQRLDVFTVGSLGETRFYDVKLGQILQDTKLVAQIRAIERHIKCLLVRKNTGHSFPKGLSNALLDYFLVACHPQDEIGLSLQSVFQAFPKVDKQLIRQTVEQLSEHGFLYSTVDEEHFRPT
jgi:hypothetical protein